MYVHGAKLSQKWEAHEAKWEACTKCAIGHLATQHVIARGQLPSDIVFIGEAPGETEDAIGEPFIGDSGQLLDKIIVELKREYGLQFPYSIINVIACAPWTNKKREEMRVPSDKEARRCSPRLSEFIELAKPEGIVRLGKVAEKHTENLCRFDIPILDLRHPSYILRNGGEGSLEFTRAVEYLKKFVEKVCGKEKSKARRKKKKVR